MAEISSIGRPDVSARAERNEERRTERAESRQAEKNEEVQNKERPAERRGQKIDVDA